MTAAENRVMKKVRILIADDHEVLRRGLRALLAMHQGWEVVEEARDGREAVEKAQSLRPDVVVLDFMMPQLNGLEAAKLIMQSTPGTEVLFFTMHNSEQLVHEAFNVGVRGYVLKSDASTDLAAAIEALQRHKPFVSSRFSRLEPPRNSKPNGDKRPAKPTAEPVTTREAQVLRLLAEGKSSKEVASVLGIALKTVETHRTNLMRKLDVHSLAGLVRYAIRNKLIVS